MASTNQQDTAPVAEVEAVAAQESSGEQVAANERGKESAADAAAVTTAEVTPATAAEPSTPVVAIGIDVGAVKTTSAYGIPGLNDNVKSLRNVDLGVVMPTCLSLPRRAEDFRKFGEEAVHDHDDAANKFEYLTYLSHDSEAENLADFKEVLKTSAVMPVERDASSFDDVHFRLERDEVNEGVAEEEIVVSSRELLAMYLRPIFLNAKRAYAEETGGSKGSEDQAVEVVCTLATPSCFSDRHRQRLESAARIAGFHASTTATNIQCLAASYLKRRVVPKVSSLSFPFVVGFVDYGASQFSVGLVVYFIPPPTTVAAEQGAEADDGEAKKPDQKATAAAAPEVAAPTFVVLREQSVVGAAGESLDFAIAEHFAAQFAQQNKIEPVGLASRKGKRLVRACHSAKHALSLNSTTNLMVDALGPDGNDARFVLKREEFTSICSAQFDRLRGALSEILALTFPSDSTKVALDSGAHLTVTKAQLQKVEMVGGGSRSPIVQDVVTSSLGVAADKLSFLLDIQLALSQGAATATPVEVLRTSQTAFSDLETASITSESRWIDSDTKNREQHRLRDKLERFIGSTRSNISESESAPEAERLDRDAIDPLLEAAEEVLYSATATGDDCEAARAKLDADIRQLCPGYYAAKEAAKAKYEAELAAASAQAKVDKANEIQEDHDRRKLPAARRLRSANMQKKEGNELFSGKNYKQATVRYVKALTELSMDKLAGELTEEETTERNGLLQSCHLNAAACWLKMGKPLKAEANCSEVLHLDAENVKALFRRATARFEMKKFDEALKDITAALKIDPEGKAANKLAKKVQSAVDKRKAAKKKMASKMFGGSKSKSKS